MTVYTFGSVNIDHFYRVPHLVRPGETLAAVEYTVGLGGKGANQSVAAARAGSVVKHIGAVGSDGAWALDRLRGFGVDVTHLAQVDAATGHAIINVDRAGENAIVIFPGANEKQSLTHVKTALASAGGDDILMLQNETPLGAEVAVMARAKGVFVVYSAAPFDAQAVAAVLPQIDLLVVNAVEAEQLSHSLGALDVPDMLITRGAEGAVWRGETGEISVPAFAVDPVDTTGAGDCFIGTVAAGLDQGLGPEAAMRLAAAASAIKVTRPGTADAIPSRDEVDAFLAERGAG